MAKFRFRLRCFGCHSVLLLVASLLVICFAYFGSSCPLPYNLSLFSCRTLATTQRDGYYCWMLCAPKLLRKMICFAHSHSAPAMCKKQTYPHIDTFTLHSVRKSLERTHGHQGFAVIEYFEQNLHGHVFKACWWNKATPTDFKKWSNMTRSCIFMIALRSTQLTPQAVVHFVTQLAKAREVAEEWCYFIWFDFCDGSRSFEHLRLGRWSHFRCDVDVSCVGWFQPGLQRRASTGRPATNLFTSEACRGLLDKGFHSSSVWTFLNSLVLHRLWFLHIASACSGIYMSSDVLACSYLLHRWCIRHLNHAACRWRISTWAEWEWFGGESGVYSAATLWRRKLENL